MEYKTDGNNFALKGGFSAESKDAGIYAHQSVTAGLSGIKTDSSSGVKLGGLTADHIEQHIRTWNGSSDSYLDKTKVDGHVLYGEGASHSEGFSGGTYTNSDSKYEQYGTASHTELSTSKLGLGGITTHQEVHNNVGRFEVTGGSTDFHLGANKASYHESITCCDKTASCGCGCSPVECCTNSALSCFGIFRGVGQVARDVGHAVGPAVREIGPVLSDIGHVIVPVMNDIGDALSDIKL